MAPSRLIGRALTQWHITASQPARCSIPLFAIVQTNAPICTSFHCRQNYSFASKRFRSDFLKHRAVEALKKRNAAESAAAPSSSNDNVVTKEEKDVALFVSENSNNTNDLGDDHQLAGLAAAAKSSENTFSTSAKKVELNQNTTTGEASSPPLNPTAAAATNATTTSSADNTTIIQQVTTNNNSAPQSVESSPWAHMQLHEFAPKIVVVGVGGAGTNAVNNMVASGLSGVEFLALNTDAQHLSTSLSPNRLQIGTELTSGLGCGANPDAGRLAAEESKEAIVSCIEDAHMVFITAGMGGGTGTGAAPVVAGLCYDLGILTVSVVTTPFRFEGTHRKRLALEGVDRLKYVSDTLIVVPNQNLFRLVGEKTSFVDSFRLADNVLLAGVRSITDLMTSPGLINLDFADVQSVMHGMGNALLGTGQACHDDRVGSYGLGDKKDGTNATKFDESKDAKGDNAADDEQECRAIRAAKMALNNPLLGDGNMNIGSAKGMLVNITGGSDMTLYEVDRAAEYITEKVLDPDANIIFGSAYDADLTGCVRVSVVATGIEEGS